MPFASRDHASTNHPINRAARPTIEPTRGILYNSAMKNTFSGIKEEIDGGNYEISPINFIISPANFMISPINSPFDGSISP